MCSLWQQKLIKTVVHNVQHLQPTPATNGSESPYLILESTGVLLWLFMSLNKVHFRD